MTPDARAKKSKKAFQTNPFVLLEMKFICENNDSASGVFFSTEIHADFVLGTSTLVTVLLPTCEPNQKFTNMDGREPLLFFHVKCYIYMLHLFSFSRKARIIKINFCNDESDANLTFSSVLRGPTIPSKRCDQYNLNMYSTISRNQCTLS